MCRSHSSGEPARRCPCTNPNKRSAYERGRRAAVRAQEAIPAEELGLEVEEPEELEVPYLEEVTTLAADISAMYLTQVKRRTARGEDESKIAEIASIYEDSPVDSDTRMNAVIRLGFLLSQRAEELAGITTEQILENEEKYRLDDLVVYHDAYQALKTARDELGEHFNGRSAFRAEHSIEELAEYDREEDELRAKVRELEEASRVASNNTTRMDNHPNTQAELDRLSAGYIAALSEIRSMGGQMEWENERNSPVVKMFDSASQVYPSEWIDYSNQFMHPFARNLNQRAHYQHYAEKKLNVKRVDRTFITRMPEDMTPEDDHRNTYTLATAEEALERYDPQPGYVVWKRTSWEVDGLDGYFKRKPGGDGRPVGAGWVKYGWLNDEGEQMQGWRRKEKYILRDEIDSVLAPEIITNLKESDSKRYNGFSTAVHELSHRYEAMVPEILEMEGDFYEYRTTNKETGEQNPLINITPSGRGRTPEVAREGGFISKYMGREYPMTDAYEVLSTGTEALFGYGYGALIGLGKSAKDDHMRSFVLGVLASAGRRYLPDDTSAE